HIQPGRQLVPPEINQYANLLRGPATRAVQAPLSHRRAIWCARLSGGGMRGVASGSVLLCSISTISSRLNQRAFSSSLGSTAIASPSASATQPIISEEGKGQGCEAR